MIGASLNPLMLSAHAGHAATTSIDANNPLIIGSQLPLLPALSPAAPALSSAGLLCCTIGQYFGAAVVRTIDRGQSGDGLRAGSNAQKGYSMNSNRPGKACRHLVAYVFVSAVTSPVFAQTTDTAPIAKPPSTPPRIGLALSGGGARGIAHIGVLKVLEELRVPVHCVTGTSMGSIVGGGFASGSSPARLEERVLKTDWDSVFTDRPPRQEISHPPQDRRLQDAVRARVRRQGRRAGAAEGHPRPASRSRAISAG